MNDNTDLDYDSIINDLLFTENRLAKKIFKKGVEKSSENSRQEGFHLGYSKGYDIGLEIGFYAGIVLTVKKLHNNKTIILTEKELHILQKLSTCIEVFPQVNDKNTNIVDQYNVIKGLYKKFCFNLKVKNLDKSILNFSKWNS